MNINLGISLAGLNDVFIHKETTPSAAVTGTLTETQVYQLLIPANSFSAGDIFNLDNIIIEKVGTAGSATVRLKVNTTPSMPAGTTGIIGDIPLSSANRTAIAIKSYNIISNTLRGFAMSASVVNGYTTSNSLNGTRAFDTSIDNYLFFSVILGDIADSVTVHGYTLKNF